MIFDHLIGNDGIKAYLRRGVQAGTLSHALLFSGLAGVGKSLFAKALGSALLKTEYSSIDTHPDFHILRPEGKSGLHSIESLRLLIDEVHKVSFEDKGKVFVILDAHKMQTASANAILKTLEEPTPDTTLILVTEHANELLPTIRSRCARLDFKPVLESDVSTFLKSKGLSESIAKLSFGSIGKALAIAEKPSHEKEVFSLLSKRWLFPDLLKKVEEIESLYQSEDPVEKGERIDSLFETILMWARDQHARKEGVLDQYLFFPDEPLSDFKIPSMEKVQMYLDTARLGVQRNLKLSVCLTSFLNSFFSESTGI